jgi:hypothetical protein
MSGSSNSNLGYSLQNPYVTNSSLVNSRSTNNPITFSSNQIPTSCMNGGKKKNIKNTYKRMKMKRYKKRNTMRKNKTKKLRTRRRIYKGGYSQFQNNLPNTPSYSIGGHLSAGNLGLANPAPFKVTNSCQDNYNHFNKTSFPSKGH